MPTSLRLPTEIESQIAGYSARQGLSKSAVIVRSIQEFLARHAQPSSFAIYQDAMRQAALPARDAQRAGAERRPLKIQARDAFRAKHAKRSEAARKQLAVHTQKEK